MFWASSLFGTKKSVRTSYLPHPPPPCNVYHKCISAVLRCSNIGCHSRLQGVRTASLMELFLFFFFLSAGILVQNRGKDKTFIKKKKRKKIHSLENLVCCFKLIMLFKEYPFVLLSIFLSNFKAFNLRIKLYNLRCKVENMCCRLKHIRNCWTKVILGCIEKLARLQF